MTKPKLLNLDPDNYSALALDTLRQAADVECLKLSRSELLQKVEGVDGIVLRFSHRIDAEVMEAAPNLRVIATNATGLDHIDTDEARNRGIQVIGLKGETEFLREITATAEHTWALLLALSRYIPEASRAVESGVWDRISFVGTELKQKRLGIVGFGRIGQIVARYGNVFSMSVAVYDPNVPSDDLSHLGFPVTVCKNLDDLFSSVDVVSVHLPLEAATHKLIGQRQLSVLPDGAILLNSSRGGVIDEAALLLALESGRLGGAALDVLANEKTPGFIDNDPLVAYARANMNLIITPHLGGATVESWEKTERFIAEKIRDFFFMNF